MRRILVLAWVAALLPPGGTADSNRVQAEPKLSFDSSDARLVEAFKWAKTQALAYAFEGDPVGPWYEAALPGREAFCMRDVAHQSTGGHALGLARHNRNMLRRFAENISESKDWCSYWEIDRYNRPAAVDYRNDAEFWYNLPANFDVLDACYRMYLWTGDLSYINDPVFLNFYDRTVTDYVGRWDLGLERVMKRKRFMNIRGTFDPARKFHFFRGDPSYRESRDEFVLGVDLLATQYAGYLAYARIQELRGNADMARIWQKKAEDVKALVNTAWWDKQHARFYSHLTKDYSFEGTAASSLLYRDVIEDGPKVKATLQQLLDSIKARPSSSVEGQSHHAEILYRYSVPDVAYAQMLDLTREDRDRREYPEVSYSVIGAMVTGTMGITVDPVPPLKSPDEDLFVDRTVNTLSGLGGTDWAELRNLRVRSNEISVRHDGSRKTVLTNQKGPSLIWLAGFSGGSVTLLVDGRPAKAQAKTLQRGNETTWVRVVVGAGRTVVAQAP